jgi:hypothetical protein
LEANGAKAAIAMLTLAAASASTTGIAAEASGAPLTLHVSLGVPALKGLPDLLVPRCLDGPLNLHSSTTTLNVELGTEYLRIAGSKRYGQYWGDDATLRFSYWPAQHVGLWFAPAYDFVFRDQKPPTASGVTFSW